MLARVVDKNKQLGKFKDTVCSRIRKKVEKGKELAKMWMTRPSLQDRFEVSHADEGYVVSLKEFSCTCGYWGLIGVPCEHVVSALAWKRLDPNLFVHKFYIVSEYKKTYRRGLPTLDGRQTWPMVEGYPMYPPKVRIMPGCPKKNRWKEAGKLETRPHEGG
ncbi:unnamed protein product [Linum trigynum]|uniref:SWIM-type domain-containing protein n=1 Tax=Linum trigynum TaxID=586398 RepID=A0AAV2GQB4_9ROSI